MILVDRRTGSGDLVKLMPGAILCDLEYGDASFLGNGPDGAQWCIGVEVKKLSDLLQCIETGRFAGHQLPGLMRSYNRVYLVLEGIWRLGHGGILETIGGGGRWYPAGHGKRRFTWFDLQKWLASMEEFGDIRVKMTSRRNDTAWMITGLYQWWQQPYEKHRAHLAFDQSLTGRAGRPESAALLEPSLTRRVAKEFPSLGWEKSLTAANEFKTVRRLVNATESDWRKLPGIGPKIAKGIVEAMDAER